MEIPPPQAAPLGPLLAGAVVNGSRVAQATERGVLMDLGCGGSLAGLTGDVTVHAQSRVPILATGDTFVDLGVGSIRGTFKVDTASGNVVGKLDGFMDFSMTNHGVTLCGGFPCPIVGAAGNWSTQGTSGLAGTFSGFALVPFMCGAPPTGLCYLDPIGALGGGFVPLDPTTDFDRFGNPVAKFILFLTD